MRTFSSEISSHLWTKRDDQRFAAFTAELLCSMWMIAKAAIYNSSNTRFDMCLDHLITRFEVGLTP